MSVTHLQPELEDLVPGPRDRHRGISVGGRDSAQDEDDGRHPQPELQGCSETRSMPGRTLPRLRPECARAGRPVHDSMVRVAAKGMRRSNNHMRHDAGSEKV